MGKHTGVAAALAVILWPSSGSTATPYSESTAQVIPKSGQIVEVVIHSPKAKGRIPTPTVIFLHGTAIAERAGTRPLLAPALSAFLGAKGWAVMYPQSQFSRITLPSDREALELFCQEQMSSARVSREVDLLVESIEMALDGMPELDKRVVLAGHSRGGILALLIASRMHSVIGVVNFSGGWIGSGCNNSEIFNQRLFVAAGSYPAVSLWIYGENDETFDMVYSARMLMAYSRAGGRAILHTKTIGDESGHGIFNFSRYWSEILSAYLTEITGVR